ncbi:TolC family protein [Sphingopyxis granuli]|uniref:TolC family protein n=1 Tax=Sphingopyxis granuli TaxID=267128 RepID=UPI001F53DE8C|nr:TolC family protein [Sphingopyxis granuli]UNK79648.1 TolC family protein [Sphingopyxis granuli]
MRAMLLACGLLLAASPALAQRTDLPPADRVNEALDNHPSVAAAAARVEAARARGDMLRKGPHEVTVSGSYIRRTVDREGGFNEFDTTISRPFRLPGKAALDREAGALGVEVARNQMEDVRHQTALVFSGLWHDWLAAGSHYRNDLDTVRGLEASIAAIARRVALRDAAQLDHDQAAAALAQARAQAASSLASREQARVTLAATFPDIPLPPEPPELAIPELPADGLEAMRDLVIERSHEIGAADKEAQRLDVTARRVRADRVADPSFGVRLFSERGGTETGAGVVASIPLGGGYRRAAADQASAEANAARMELSAVTRTVEAMANADLSNARTRFNAWSNTESSARSAGDAAARTARGYQLGQIDLVDLLYAQRQTNDARRMEIDARSEANRALLRLEIDSHSIWAATDRE